MSNRFKNYGLWVAVFAFIPLLATALGTYDIRVLIPDNYDKLVLGILGIGTLLGLWNNPTTEGKGFSDDK